MAQGTLLFVDNFSRSLAKGNHDLTPTTGNTFKCMLVSEGVGSILTTSVDSSSFTEVTGGTNYTAGGVTLTQTLSETNGVTTLGSSVNPSWLQDASGPTNIKTALIYNATATSEDLIAYIDMTVDNGTTAISLQSGDISITFAGGVIGTIG